MKTTILLSGICFLVLFGVQAQTKNICGTSHLNSISPDIQSQVANVLKKARTNDNAVYTLPVVFIVYHLGEAVGTGSNVSDATINSVLADLNNAYRSRSPYSGGTDTHIEFQKISYNNNCGSSTGIVRVNASGVSGYSTNGISTTNISTINALRTLHNYNNREEYITIEIVTSISDASGFADYLGGYVFMDSNSFWSGLLAHEIGHCLNLMHTFEGSTGTNCPLNTNPETYGDLISDTDPHQATGTPFCSSSSTVINTCTGLPYGNLLKNFMGYNSPCWGIFTPKQRERMRLSIETYKPNWINSRAITGIVLAPKSNGMTFCRPQTVSLTATGCYETYKWYASGSGGAVLATGATYTTPVLSASATYYVECSVTGCSSSLRTAVNAVYSPVLASSGCTVTDPNGPGGYFGIKNFTMGSIAFTGWTSGYLGTVYIPNSCSVYMFTASQPWPFTLQTPNNAEYIRIYLDMDNNGVFDESTELLYASSTKLANHSGTVTFPASALKNTNLRMRVLSDFMGVTACSLTGYNDGTTNYGSGLAVDFAIQLTSCPTTIVHSGAVVASSYKAVQTIQSSGNIASGTLYQAGKSITLTPGFQVGANKVFTAQIGGCD